MTNPEPKSRHSVRQRLRRAETRGRVCQFCYVGDENARWGTGLRCGSCDRAFARVGACPATTHPPTIMQGSPGGRFCPICGGPGLVPVTLICPLTGHDKRVFTRPTKDVQAESVVEAPTRRAWLMGRARPARGEARADPLTKIIDAQAMIRGDRLALYQQRASEGRDLFTGRKANPAHSPEDLPPGWRSFGDED